MEEGVGTVLLVLARLKVEEDERLERRLLGKLEGLHEALVLTHVHPRGAGGAPLCVAGVRTPVGTVDAEARGTAADSATDRGRSPRLLTLRRFQMLVEALVIVEKAKNTYFVIFEKPSRKKNKLTGGTRHI